MIVFISTSTFAEFDSKPLDLLRGLGMEVRLNPYGRKLKGVELVDLAAGAAGLIAGTESLDRKILQELTSLKAVSRCGAGMDNLDLQAAKELGIRTYNTGDISTEAVAELTVGLILTLLRKITLMDQQMRNGLWKKRMGSLLAGKQVGIIGFGRVGSKVASFLKAMMANVYYTDILVREKGAGIFSRVELKELLKKSDIVSLHLSYSKENYKLLGKDEFFLMKQGSFLINCSRGGIVDEDALYSALKKGKLAGAAIDVFEQEPYNGPLRELDNVVLTPHIGSYAREARIRMETQAAKNLIKGLGHSID